MDFDQPWDDDDDDEDPRRDRTPIQLPKRADIFDISTPVAIPPLPPPPSIPHPVPLTPMQPVFPQNPFSLGTTSQLPLKHITRPPVTRPFALPQTLKVIRPPRPRVGPEKHLETSSPWSKETHDRERRDRPPRSLGDDIRSPLVPQRKLNPLTPSDGFRSPALESVPEEVESPIVTKHIPKEPESEITVTKQMSKNQAELDHQTAASSSQASWTPIKPTIHHEPPRNDEDEEADDKQDTLTYFAQELATEFSGLASDDRDVLCDRNHITTYLSEMNREWKGDENPVVVANDYSKALFRSAALCDLAPEVF